MALMVRGTPFLGGSGVMTTDTILLGSPDLADEREM